MSIEAWFYTPIYYNFVDNNKLETIQHDISNTVQDLESKNKFRKHNEWGLGNHSLSDPTFADNIILLYNLESLKEELDKHVHNYLNNFSEHNYKINLIGSWLTKTLPGESTATHNHGDSDISGVYYFKTNTQDGSLFFLNPLPSLVTSTFLSSDEVVYYPPEIGKLILFPSWLYHGVRSNDTDSIRISLAFNYKVYKDD